MSGLYIHIPYCEQACYYCDFHFSTSLQQRAEMTSALCEELRLQKNYLGDASLRTIYFGGGTPSLLRVDELSKIFQTIGQYYDISRVREITVEANPNDVTPEKLIAWRQFGVNRLSIGVQTFHDDLLQTLHRSHRATTAKQCVAQIRQHLFENFSLDLMFAIPGQSNAMLLEDIETCLALHPPHISAYSLTIEPNTVFGRRKKRGNLHEVSNDNAAGQFKLIMSRLSAVGYDQYEISNFCLPGSVSHHNSAYWQEQPYLGIGPGAHSYNLRSRQKNISNNPLYIRALSNSTLPAEVEELAINDRINEFILTSLRTRWGCNLSTLHARYEYCPTEKINALIRQGLLSKTDETLYLTHAGKLLADSVAAELFI